MELTWEAPGPGRWFAEPEHMPRPCSRLFNDMFPEIMGGWARGGATYGLGAGTSRAVGVNGVLYFSFEESAPDDAEEIATARRERRWLAEYRRWTETERPAVMAANRALQAVDPVGLDDDALAGHVRVALEHAMHSAPLHFEHVGRGVVIGLLMDEVATLGFPRDHALDLCAGRSDATTEPSVRLAGIADALRAGGVREVTSLGDVRSLPAARVLLDAYLDDYGWRLLHGYDPVEPCITERPDLVLAAVVAAMAGVVHKPVVPPPVPEGLEELVGDASLLYGTRDDDDGICFLWPMGLLRRALLELGSRAAARGELVEADDVFECDRAELDRLLDGEGPPPEELAARTATRRAAALMAWPTSLGGDPGGDPGAGERAAPPATVGQSAYTGRARVIDAAGDGLDALEPGEVLIAVTTGPAFNTIFPVLGAVAVETGGIGSHTALLARELGIPAVIGMPGLTSTIRTGAMVEVDPVAATVRVIGDAESSP